MQAALIESPLNGSRRIESNWMPIVGKMLQGEKCVQADTLVHNFGTPPITDSHVCPLN